MSVATIVCGVWSLTRIFKVVRSGGVGKNGSTVAVSEKKNKTKSKKKLFWETTECAFS